MSEPDPNNELRHLIRSAKAEVAALDARFDRLERAVIDQRTDLDHVRVVLDGHTGALVEHGNLLREHGNLLREHGDLLREILRRLPEEPQS